MRETMRIQDFNPVIKEDNEMADIVTAHGLVGKALDNAAARQEYFNYMTHLRNKHGKEYSTRIHQKATALAKPVAEGWKDAAVGAAMLGALGGTAAYVHNQPHVEVDGVKWTITKHTPGPLAHPHIGTGADGKQYQVWRGSKGMHLAHPIDSKQVDETIVKVGSQYELKSHTGKNLGKYPTRAGAEKREQQVNYFKHVNEAGGNYEELKNRRLRNEDPFVVYDHTLNGVILTSDSLEEATKEAVEWAAYDDITVSVIKKATKRKVLTIDGYSGAMDYYEEHGFPEELDEDAWTGDNPAWNNGTDQWHSADDGSGGAPAAPLTGALPIEEDFNPQDVVSVDVPLLIRLLEYAREDAKTDMDLHNVTERLIALSQEGNTLTMQDYDTICNTKETD